MEALLFAKYKQSRLFDRTADATPAWHELLFVPGPVLDKSHPFDR
jgi:hypothetical protein